MKLVIPDGVKRIFGNFSESKDVWYATTDYDFRSGNYEISEDGQDYYIGGMREKIDEIHLPASLEEIGEDAFASIVLLESIVIPPGVEFIGNNAFAGLEHLAKVDIPLGVKIIGNEAFAGCFSLVEVNFHGENVESIGDKAFANCIKLPKINIPSSVRGIGFRCFENCHNLLEANFLGKIEKIGLFAFRNCHSLQIVTTASSLPIVEANTFYNCKNLDGMALVLRTGIYDTSLIKGICSTGSRSILIPEGVRTIVESGFEGWEELESVELPNSLESIGCKAFAGCINLREIIIPKSVTHIGWGAFMGCGSLLKVRIPSGIKTIGHLVFANCVSLNVIRFPSNVSVIAWQAFSGCSNLLKIIFDRATTYIEDHAFLDCSSLMEVEHRESFLIFEDRAGNNIELFSRILPPSIFLKNYRITLFDKILFDQIKGSSDLDFNENNREIIKTKKLLSFDPEYPMDLNALMKGTIDWSTAINSFGIYQAEVSKTNSTLQPPETSEDKKRSTYLVSEKTLQFFSEDSTKAQLDLQYSNNKIEIVFKPIIANNDHLQCIQIPDVIEVIAEYVFRDQKQLTEVTLPNSLAEIRFGAFEGCCNLLKIEIPTSTKSVGAYSFAECESLEEVIFHEGLEIIEESAFANCNKLIRLIIPSSIQRICGDAFFGCSKIQELLFIDQVKPTKNCIDLKAFNENVITSILEDLFPFISLANLSDEEKLTFCKEHIHRVQTGDDNCVTDYIRSATDDAIFEFIENENLRPEFFRLIELFLNDENYEILLERAIKRQLIDVTAIILDRYRDHPHNETFFDIT